MGFDTPSGSTKEEREAFEKKRDETYKQEQALLANRERVRRHMRAQRIVNAIVEAITVEIIRPGPKPEERECTTVAAEIEAMKPRLIEIAYEAASRVL